MNSTSRLVRRAALPALPLTLLPAAQAAIVHTDPADFTLPAGTGFIYFDVNLDGGGAPIRSTYFYGADFNLYFIGGNGGSPYLLNYLPNAAVATASPWGGMVFRLDAGEVIDGSQTFNGFGGYLNNYANTGEWTPGTTGYLGLKLVANGNTYYGWARVTYGVDQSLTIHDFAYNDTPGEAIEAGDTGAPPEPEPRRPKVPERLLEKLGDKLPELPPLPSHVNPPGHNKG